MAANHNPRPRAAREVSAERVVSARAGDGAQWLEAVGAQNLAPGTVVLGLTTLMRWARGASGGAARRPRCGRGPLARHHTLTAG